MNAPHDIPPGKVDYDRIAASYDLHRDWSREIPLRLLARAAGAPSGSRALPVLELGCGTGNVTRWLSEQWRGPVAALDLSRGMLARASAKVSGVQLVHGDARSLPFRDGTFHAALGSFFLHHLDAPGRTRLFAELRRTLQNRRGVERGAAGGPGGVAFLTSSHAQIRAFSLARWMPSVALIDCRRFPDLDELQAGLFAAGFRHLEIEEVRRNEPRGGHAFLEKTKARYLSTLELVPPEELAQGLAAMERQLAADGHLGDVSWHATIVSARYA